MASSLLCRLLRRTRMNHVRRRCCGGGGGWRGWWEVRVWMWETFCERKEKKMKM